ncbi:MAG: hypothetical protein QOK04_1974 [Solirubrobacteraceae bacterium]|jgi:uncharacterized protein YjeT (DUF2065 family)|nr:hypothetical protein [Solirubrobacteraceae bacterium]
MAAGTEAPMRDPMPQPAAAQPAIAVRRRLPTVRPRAIGLSLLVGRVVVWVVHAMDG